jgi:hypothetical protein
MIDATNADPGGQGRQTEHENKSAEFVDVELEDAEAEATPCGTI